MQGKKTGPMPTPFQGIKPHPPGTPLPHPELADMDAVHRNVASGALVDLLVKIAGKGK